MRRSGARPFLCTRSAGAAVQRLLRPLTFAKVVGALVIFAAATLPLLPQSVQAAPPTFVAAASAGTAAATFLTINTPAGTAGSDVMLAQITVEDGTTVTITPPAGWTQVIRTDSTTVLAQAIYVKVAGANEPASYTWNFNLSKDASGGILTYRGVQISDPVDVSGGQANASSTAVVAPSITTTVADTFVVGFFASNIGSITFTPPGGMAERYDVNSSTNVGAASEGRTWCRPAQGRRGRRPPPPGTPA